MSDKKRVFLDLTEAVHQQAKVAAIGKGTTLKAFIEAAILASLAKPKKGGKGGK